MKCKKCGMENRIGEFFCSKCGANLEDEMIKEAARTLIEKLGVLLPIIATVITVAICSLLLIPSKICLAQKRKEAKAAREVASEQAQKESIARRAEEEKKDAAEEEAEKKALRSEC